MALVGPLVEPRGLVASLAPHSFLDFGDGIDPQRLSLGRGRVSFPRCLLLFFGQVFLQVTFMAELLGEPSLAYPKVESNGSPLWTQTHTVVAALVPPDDILAGR